MSVAQRAEGSRIFFRTASGTPFALVERCDVIGASRVSCPDVFDTFDTGVNYGTVYVTFGASADDAVDFVEYSIADPETHLSITGGEAIDPFLRAISTLLSSMAAAGMITWTRRSP